MQNKKMFLIIFLLCVSATIEGKEYTIQVGVASDSAQAELVRGKIMEATTEAVYITRDSVFYKIQVGSFSSEESAKPVQVNLQKKGYTGFIVPATPKSSSRQTTGGQTRGGSTATSVTHKVSSPVKTPKCTIQVGVCSDSLQAEMVRAKILKVTTESVYIIKDSSSLVQGTGAVSYKIQIGCFSSPDSAKLLATELRRKGYTGFIIKVSTSFPSVSQEMVSEFRYGIQLRTCSNKNEADSVLKEYETVYHIPAYILFISLSGEPADYKIMTGEFETQKEAEEVKILLEKGGQHNLSLVPLKKHSTESKINQAPINQTSTAEFAEGVQPKPSIITKGFYVEIDVFKDKGSAEQLQKKLQNELSKQVYIVEKLPYYKVIFVDFGSVDEAMEIVSILQKSGYEKALVIFE